MVLMKSMLFAELTKVENDCLYYNRRISSMPGVGFDCFSNLVVETKNMIENIADEAESIA
jgi:hypothetical protein